MDNTHFDTERLDSEAMGLGGQERVPLVIVEGFLCVASKALWGNFEEHSNTECKSGNETSRREVIFVSVGPVSSLHDRACELFYALKGGMVDYGEKHAHKNGHSRYGRTHAEGLYPEWSRKNPLHFLGHSLGGPTIIKLQWLISTGFFGKSYHPDMLLSVNAVSAPFRGTQLVYWLGECADAAPAVRLFSLGAALAMGIHIASYFSPLLPSMLQIDLHAESRSLSFQEMSLSSLCRQLWHSDWAESKDATPFDVTFQASDEREANMEGVPNPGTFYRSYAACMTTQSGSKNYHKPSLQHALTTPPLYLSSCAMGRFDYSLLNPTPSFLPATRKGDLEEGIDPKLTNPNCEPLEALRANDGVVPLFSQWHPFECRSTQCLHHRANSAIVLQRHPEELVAGIWNVYHLEDATHFSIVPFWLGTDRQKAFWRDIGEWLRAVDDTRIPENL